jgi:DNA-binding YbaB/EbfC family protein
MDMQQIMKKAQDLQNKMKDAQERLEHVEVSGSAGGGNYSVKVTLSGKGVAKKCEIDQALLEDKGMLEDIIVAAFNNTKNKVDEAVNAIMEKLGISPDMLK